MMKPTVLAPVLALATLSACGSIYSSDYNQAPPPNFTTFQAQGDSLAVDGAMAAFRTALGGALNAPNTPPAADGRREINWDGVPAALTNVDTFPLTFFNVNSKRGAVYVTPGTGLRIDSTGFGALNPALADQFKPFSGKKLFMAVGSTRVGIDFQLVGTTTPGAVKGFGVVFSDVDRGSRTRVDFFNAAGARIASLQAPTHAGAQEFSFIGAVFTSAIVARVEITSGEGIVSDNAADVTAGGNTDLVVMDDFIYGEPLPIAE